MYGALAVLWVLQHQMMLVSVSVGPPDHVCGACQPHTSMKLTVRPCSTNVYNTRVNTSGVSLFCDGLQGSW